MTPLSAIATRFLAFSLLLMLLACSPATLLGLIASAEEQALARSYIESLRGGDFEPILEASDSSLKSELPLSQMAAVFPSEKPKSITLVGANRFTAKGTSTLALTYEYEFTDQWLLAEVVLEQRNDESKIVGFHVSPREESLKEQNRFTLTGKTPTHYLILLLAIVLPLFTLWALILCIRTKFKGKKWPWILFVIVGFCQLGINWTTGDLSFKPLWVQLFSAGFSAAFNGPVTLSIAAPVGAVIFLLRRNELKAEEPAADPNALGPIA